MRNKIHILKIRKANEDIFRAIKNGRKKIETRAAIPKYTKVETGDALKFVCGENSSTKRVKSVKIFRTIKTLLKTYKSQEISPSIKTEKDLEKMYYSFPNYKKKLKKYGLIAFKLG